MSAPVPFSGQVLPVVWKLLRLRLRLSFNSFRHSRLRSKIFTVLGLLGLLAFAGFIFFMSWLLLGFLRSPLLGQYAGLDAGPLLESMPVLLFTGLFVGILLTSFGVLLQALYLAGDMDFLLSSPVPIRAVFITKLLQAVLPNFGLFAFFGLPVLYGLGISAGYRFVYYPLVLVVMVALTLAAAGFSALLVMAVVRVLPPRRAAEILGFIGATLGLLCSQIGNFSQSFGKETDLSQTQLSSLFSLANRFNTLWLPLNWAGRGLVDLGEGRWLSGSILLVLTLALASACFWFALVTAEGLYYSGWAGMQVIARHKKPARAPRSTPSQKTAATSQFERLVPGPVRGMLVKDFLVLRRDLRNLSQLISPLIIGVIYALMFLRSGGEPLGGRGEAPGWFMDSFRSLLAFGNVGISLFVGWMLLSRLAGMSFSQEGRNFWMLKAAPVSPRQMLAAKFLVAYLPTLALGWFFLISVSLLQGLSPGQFAYSLLAVTICLAGLTGIQIGFGVAGANFKWDDPRRMNAGGLGCLGQVVTMLFLPIGFGFFIGPLFLALALQLPQTYGYLAGLLLGVGVNLGCAILPPKLMEKRVERLGEN